MDEDVNEGLLVVWTSGDRDVAVNMVFMYARNARKHGWWEDLTLLVWGPSQKLLTEDRDLQDRVQRMVTQGIRIIACKACAESYDIAVELEAHGVEVFYTGELLTGWIRSGGHVITF